MYGEGDRWQAFGRKRVRLPDDDDGDDGVGSGVP